MAYEVVETLKTSPNTAAKAKGKEILSVHFPIACFFLASSTNTNAITGYVQSAMTTILNIAVISYFAISASISSASNGMFFIRSCGPFAVTRISFSKRMPKFSCGM